MCSLAACYIISAMNEQIDDSAVCLSAISTHLGSEGAADGRPVPRPGGHHADICGTGVHVHRRRMEE